MTKHIHGGNIYTYQNCLDFSANCNPLGTPESVKKAVQESLDKIKDYPQVGYAPLRDALGEYEDMESRTYYLRKRSGRVDFFSLSGSPSEKGPCSHSHFCGI